MTKSFNINCKYIFKNAKSFSYKLTSETVRRVLSRTMLAVRCSLVIVRFKKKRIIQIKTLVKTSDKVKSKTTGKCGTTICKHTRICV